MNNIIFIVLFLIIIIIGSFILLRLKMRLVTKAVLTSFYKENALTENRAIIPEELGLNSHGFLSSIFYGHNY
ncbi:hypothetical protein ES705_23773 [subsurface metagenome]